MKTKLAFLLALPILAATVEAQEARFRFRGDVAAASNPNGAYTGVQVGDAVELVCDVFTVSPAPTVIAPGQYVIYAIDTATMSMSLGTVTVPYTGGTPGVGMVNAYPVSDGVQNVAASMGSKSMSYSINHNSGLWTSVDPLLNAGTHPIVLDGSFSFTFQVTGGGTFIEIMPTSIVVEIISTGTDFCFGDGSGAACPCSNSSPVGDDVGCLNSLGQGGKLRATGLASVASDSLVLQGTQMPNSSALYFQGSGQAGGGMGIAFGDGLRCASGSIIRLGTKTNAGGGSQYPVGADQSVSVRGLVSPGSTYNYQVWYRNAASFCTTSTFNLTNGVSVLWS